MSDREEAIKDVMKSYGNTASAVYHDEGFIDETMDYLRKNIPDNSFPVMQFDKTSGNDRSYSYHWYDNKVFIHSPKTYLTLENDVIPGLKPNEFVNVGQVNDLFDPLVYIKHPRFKYLMRYRVILGHGSHYYDDIDEKIIQDKVNSIIPELNMGYGIRLVVKKEKKLLDSVYNQCKLEHWLYIKYFRLSMV